MKKTYCILFIVFLSISCKKNKEKEETALFESTPVSMPLVPVLDEISGIADSKINPGYLWGHEDSGSPAVIYLIGHDGNVLKSIFLKDATNRDWEDMVLAGGQIYLAETGDNSQVFTDYLIYKFPEPAQTADTVKNIQTVRFSYPDGPHDAEALLVDSATMDIFILTKNDNPSRIYKLTWPYGTTNIALPAGTLDYSGVVSASLASGGVEILVKTYGALYHYKRKSGQNIAQTLQNVYTQVQYVAEPQGEAIGFAADNSGFFTLSEKGAAGFVNLNFYKRR